jgi:hypothetical protein
MSTRRWWLPAGALSLFLALAVPALTKTRTEPQSAGQTAEQTDQIAKPEKTGKTAKTKKSEDSKKSQKDKSAKKKDKLESDEEKAAGLPAVLVRQPYDIATLDLFGGIDGRDGAPDPAEVYTFLKEDLSQTQPKFDVKDSKGRVWRVKMGEEAQPEVVATRLVWAMGYYTDADYYLTEVKVKDLPRLKRGEKYVKGSVVQGARLRLQGVKTVGNWPWLMDTPFVGTRELNGLRTVMALLNNWDLITRNNKIYRIDEQRRYVVSDLGASFGRSGNEFSRKKNNLEAYVNSDFIDKMHGEEVDFKDNSRPIPPAILAGLFLKQMPHYYSDMANAQKVVKNVPIADAKWMGKRLAQLSEDQIRDAFRAAAYTPEEIEAFTKKVRERIGELNALPGNAGSPEVTRSGAPAQGVR